MRAKILKIGTVKNGELSGWICGDPAPHPVPWTVEQLRLFEWFADLFGPDAALKAAELVLNVSPRTENEYQHTYVSNLELSRLYTLLQAAENVVNHAGSIQTLRAAVEELNKP